MSFYDEDVSGAPQADQPIKETPGSNARLVEEHDPKARELLTQYFSSVFHTSAPDLNFVRLTTDLDDGLSDNSHLVFCLYYEFRYVDKNFRAKVHLNEPGTLYPFHADYCEIEEQVTNETGELTWQDVGTN
jgi:hypothetical protein